MPKYNVWMPERGEEESEGRVIVADTPQYAARKWCEQWSTHYDWSNWPVTLHVQWVELDPNFVDVIEVDREILPGFTARRPKPLPEAQQKKSDEYYDRGMAKTRSRR